MTVTEILTDMGACREATEWARDYPSIEAAWNNCERADWLIWFAANCGVDRRVITDIACKCMRLVPLNPELTEMLEQTEAWMRGESVDTDTLINKMHRLYMQSFDDSSRCEAMYYLVCLTASYFKTGAASVVLRDIDKLLYNNDELCDIVRDQLPGCPLERST